jgi:glucosamine--fructose-6-phosphate aminotransferase (isomerizing)
LPQSQNKEANLSELAKNIQAQPESLARALRYQCKDGAATMSQAAAILRSAKKVVIAAMGASLFASIPLQYYLSSLGVDAVVSEAGELLHYLEGSWKNAVVLMVSRSGESIEIARLLAIMKGKVPIIGVTNEPLSQLSRSADVSLLLSSLPDQIVAIQTYTGTLLALHLLGNAVAGRLDASSAELRELIPAFASHVESSVATIEQWDTFLHPDSNIYLLGRGPSVASTLEGALLFHEVAKAPAVAMPIASFRHGPVEVVDGYFRGFVFAPEDNTRELNLAMAEDLVRFGGQVRLIGPSSSVSQSLTICETPALPGTLAPLFEIVPLQVAALRLAILRGIEPGSFRYAPQVAVDEASFTRKENSR